MLRVMLYGRLEVCSRMLYIYCFFVQKVYFGPDNFTGCVEFVLGVCNYVSSNCYYYSSTMDVSIISNCLVVEREKGVGRYTRVKFCVN